MKTITATWEASMYQLLAELLKAKEAYRTLFESCASPTRKEFFKKQEQQKTKFSKVLTDELFTVGHRVHTKRQTSEPYIFDTLAATILNRNLSDIESERLIMTKEKALVQVYRDVLIKDGMPKSSIAILQFQAEKLNVQIQHLQLDWKVKA